MTKTKEQTVRVKVNPANRNGTDRDEVSIQSAKWEAPKDEATPAEPYINRMVYAKPGVFTDGEMSESEAASLEQKSAQILQKEAAALMEKPAAVKDQDKATEKKSEG